MPPGNPRPNMPARRRTMSARSFATRPSISKLQIPEAARRRIDPGEIAFEPEVSICGIR